MIDFLKKTRVILMCFICVIVTLFIYNFALTTSICVKSSTPAKTNIHDATIKQLDEVSGIGTKLSNSIYDYVHKNDIQIVEDLKGSISGLGEVKINSLKEVYQ